MSNTNSLSKKSDQPRFFVFLCALVALWVAIPLILELSSTTASAQAGNVASLNAQLTGEPIGGVTPRGFAYYFAAPAGSPEPPRQLSVSVTSVNLPNGTQLSVALNASPIGTITLHSNSPSQAGQGSLNLSTTHGDTVPAVVAGDVLTVGPAASAGTTTYLTGTFAAPATPSPSGTHTPFPSPSHTPNGTPSHTPFPTPSHTPFPSPSGTPLPPRAFAARMNGANEVPPVTSNGQGFGFVMLNSAESQIRVCAGFRGLSSTVTAITVNGPASTSENGPVIFTLTLPNSVNGFTSQTFDVTADQVTQLRGGLWYLQVATTNNPEGEIRGQINPLNVHNGPGHGGGPTGGGDGTGGGNDGGDLAQASDDTELSSRSGYIPVPFDFDEDGITDIAVFRASDGNWYVTRSSDGRTVAYQVDAPTE